MPPTVIDRVAWSVGLSVCRSVTLVSPAKTAKPTAMPFGLRIRVRPGNHVLGLDGDSSLYCFYTVSQKTSHAPLQLAIIFTYTVRLDNFGINVAEKVCN